MPDGTDSFWLNDFNTLTLETSGGSTDLVAGIRGVTLEAEYQTFERLYTADSTVAVTDKQAQFNVPVSIEYAFFDPTFAEEWLGGDGTSSTSQTDTSDPQEYKLTGDFRNRDGSKKIEVTVTGITFENIPLFDASMDEYVVWGLEGNGKDVSNFTGGTVA